MGDPYGSGAGGGVFLFRNDGRDQAAAFASAVTLIPISKKAAIDAPNRPDVGLYMDAGDVDGDGDPDLVVGGYSNWTPKAKELTAEQQQRVSAIGAEIDQLKRQLQALNEAAAKLPAGLSEDEVAKRYTAAYQAQKPERDAIRMARAPLDKELGELVPPMQRRSFVWLYTNTTAK
jgi:FG-GAP repeat